MSFSSQELLEIIKKLKVTCLATKTFLHLLYKSHGIKPL